MLALSGTHWKIVCQRPIGIQQSFHLAHGAAFGGDRVREFFCPVHCEDTTQPTVKRRQSLLNAGGEITARSHQTAGGGYTGVSVTSRSIQEFD
jgi:hypothetical protein